MHTMNRSTLAHAVLETLDQRRLLSAAPTPVLDAGLLAISGTADNDRIVVALSPTDPTKLSVRVNKTSFEYNVADISDHVRINALRGNDRIAVSNVNGPVTLDFEVYGGTGNDRISTDAGDDTISGGAGNDLASGGAGNDLVKGDAGSDRLNGDDGDDRLNGGGGNDRENGGAGGDVLSGDAGNDNLDGGDGDDNLFGGSGQDVLSGAAGNDDLYGNSANDALDGGAGDDALVGGGGHDAVTGGEGKDAFDGSDDVSERSDDGEGDKHLATFEDLPQAVQDAINTNYPGATIFKVEPEDPLQDGTPVYQLKLLQGGHLSEVVYSADGTLQSHQFEGENQRLTIDQLPQPVQATYATFTGALLRKLELDDGDSGNEYQFRFVLNGVEHELVVDATGTILKHEFAGSHDGSPR
jgi:Ca2+-binding RTX toxin-like protein